MCVCVCVCVQVFDTVGRYRRAFGQLGTAIGSFRCPCGIAVDAVGNWFVCDSRNYRVQVFDAVGSFLTAFAAPDWRDDAGPRGICVDADDQRIFVATVTSPYIGVFGFAYP